MRDRPSASGIPRVPHPRPSGLWPLFLIALPALAWPDEPRVAVRLVPDRVRQGGIALLSVEWPSPIRALRIQVGNRPIPTQVPEGQTRSVALIGVDLEQPPGPLAVRAEAMDETGRPVAGQGTLRVLDGRYPVQRLTLPRAFVELDAATLERVSREQAVLDRLWESATPERFWRGPFQIPVDGAGTASGFGLRRIINGEPRAPHTGADFSAPQGAPVLAANAGVVALVDDQFFAGRSVVLDHGLGLYTMYFHLEESLVRPGQRVGRGDPIARVGQSGRATGPHLHWGARLHGTRIDPQELLRLWPLE